MSHYLTDVSKHMQRRLQMPENSIPQKKCTKCGQEKPATLDFFNADKRGRNGISPCCKLCINAYFRDYRQNNPEFRMREIQQQRVYMQLPEVRKKIKQQKHEKRQNPEYREREKQTARDWMNTERGRSLKRATYERRRAKLLGAEGTYAASDIDLQYRSQKGKCWHCGQELNGKFHVDHLIPLDKDGSNWPNNLVCSCAFCNRSKGAKLTQEWNGKLF